MTGSPRLPLAALIPAVIVIGLIALLIVGWLLSR